MRAVIFSLILCVVVTVKAGTYYIDYEDGRDTNNGLTTTLAWKRHPYMNGFSGSYSHQAGDRFVFKGGVVWPAAALGLLITKGGTSAEWDHYTADKTWFNGSAWTRPVFDAQSTVLSGAGGNRVFYTSGTGYVVYEHLEVRNQYFAGFSFTRAAFSQYDAHDVLIKDCYIHDWKAEAGMDHKLGGVICNGSNSNIILDSCHIQGSLNADNTSSGFGTYGVRTVRFCEIHDVPNGIFGAVIAHDNHVHHIRSSQSVSMHENAFWCYAGTGEGAGRVYNNVVHDVGPGSGGIYPVIAWDGSSGTIYLYNNIIFNHESGSVQVDPSGCTTSSVMKVYVFNNILGSVITTPPRGDAIYPPFATFHIKNNLFIRDSGTGISIYRESGTGDKQIANNQYLTATEAAVLGMTKTNFFKPEQAVGIIKDKGLDLSSFFNFDHDNLERPQGGAWDIGAYEYVTTGIDVPAFTMDIPVDYSIPRDNILYDLRGRRRPAGMVSTGIYLTVPAGDVAPVRIFQF